MASTTPVCVNHPKVETRISCSSCGDPICTRCMRQSAVGQKCPRCAAPARGARALGKPVHYLRAVGAGLATAIAGGLVYRLVLGSVGFGRLLLAVAAGYAVGVVVRWGASGQTQPPFPAIAAGLAVAGIVIVYLPALALLARPFALIGLAAAGYGAVLGLRR